MLETFSLQELPQQANQDRINQLISHFYDLQDITTPLCKEDLELIDSNGDNILQILVKKNYYNAVTRFVESLKGVLTSEIEGREYINRKNRQNLDVFEIAICADLSETVTDIDYLKTQSTPQGDYDKELFSLDPKKQSFEIAKLLIKSYSNFAICLNSGEYKIFTSLKNKRLDFVALFLIDKENTTPNKNILRDIFDLTGFSAIVCMDEDIDLLSFVAKTNYGMGSIEICNETIHPIQVLASNKILTDKIFSEFKYPKLFLDNFFNIYDSDPRFCLRAFHHAIKCGNIDFLEYCLSGLDVGLANKLEFNESDFLEHIPDELDILDELDIQPDELKLNESYDEELLEDANESDNEELSEDVYESAEEEFVENKIKEFELLIVNLRGQIFGGMNIDYLFEEGGVVNYNSNPSNNRLELTQFMEHKDAEFRTKFSDILTDSNSYKEIEKLYIRERKGYILDINQIDLENKSALHQAVTHKGLDVMKTLLKYGVNKDSQDQDDKTALHYIAESFLQDSITDQDKSFYINALMLMIEVGAKMEICDKNSETPMNIFEKIINPNLKNEVFKAIQIAQNTKDLDEKLYEFIQIINKSDDDAEKTRLLRNLAEACSVEAIQTKRTREENIVENIANLIKCGADLNKKNKDDKTPTEIIDGIENYAIKSNLKKLIEGSKTHDSMSSFSIDDEAGDSSKISSLTSSKVEGGQANSPENPSTSVHKLKIEEDGAPLKKIRLK